MESPSVYEQFLEAGKPNIPTTVLNNITDTCDLYLNADLTSQTTDQIRAAFLILFAVSAIGLIFIASTIMWNTKL